MMVESLHSKDVDCLLMSMWDASMTYFGTYTLQDDEHLCGVREGHIYRADSGMQFVGNRTPKTGYRKAFRVMTEDLGCCHPGVDTHVKGGAGHTPRIEALNTRDGIIGMQCPAEFPKLVKKPLQGSCLIIEGLNVQYILFSTMEDKLT